MPITEAQILDKAEAIIRALTALTAKERQDAMSPEAAADYNRLRLAALEVRPDLADLMPLEIPIFKAFSGPATNNPYQDLRSFSEQIVGLVGGGRVPMGRSRR